jgi:hypothetical protein
MKKSIQAHSKTQYKRLVAQGANVLPPPQTAFMVVVERLRYIADTDDARFGDISSTLTDAANCIEQLLELQQYMEFKRREWVGLADDEIQPMIKKAMGYYGYDQSEPSHLTAGAGFRVLANAIEAKLREKNGG